MQQIKDMRFVVDAVDVIYQMYLNGWDERNGGNFSYLLTEQEASLFDSKQPERVLDIGFDASYLAGRFVLVSATGQFFRNVKRYPEEVLGIVKILSDGHSIGVYWGFVGGGRPTSEFPSHILCHIERLKHDPAQRVVIHTHSTYTLALTYMLPDDERTITRALWKMSTECSIVFPEGVGYLPWELCGTVKIGQDTARKMEKYKIVLWSMHGVYASGDSLNEAFGLIETVEKAAKIYCITAAHRVREIEDRDIAELGKAFGVTVNKEML